MYAFGCTGKVGHLRCGMHLSFTGLPYRVLLKLLKEEKKQSLRCKNQQNQKHTLHDALSFEHKNIHSTVIQSIVFKEQHHTHDIYIFKKQDPEGIECTYYT